MRARYRANDVLRVQASAYTLNAAERALVYALGERIPRRGAIVRLQS